MFNLKPFIMNDQMSLKISKPCLEDFNQFKPTLDGGFCGSCQKEVIDFSTMNSEEIMNYFKNNQSQDVCGRFKSNQLKTYKEKPKNKLNFWTGIGLACLSIFSMGTMQSQTNAVKNTSKKTISNQEKKFIVKGNVSDELGGIADVSVLLQGTKIGTVTNFDGNFEFPQKLSVGDVLVFSQISMESKKVVITAAHSKSTIDLKVNMKSDTTILMGKVAVKKVYKSKNRK